MREDCPLCGHGLEQHTYTGDDGRAWLLYYCEMCEADFARRADDVLVSLSAPLGTRPVYAVPDMPDSLPEDQ